MLVPDAWQRRGVGSLIIEACLEIAADWGLREVVGETERLNSGMLATFKKAGFELHYNANSDVVKARLEITPAGVVQVPVIRSKALFSLPFASRFVLILRTLAAACHSDSLKAYLRQSAAYGERATHSCLAARPLN